MIKVGDLVRRLDIPGSGTGILYRVLSIGEEREYHVLRRSRGYNTQILELTRRVKLKPAIVVFESKLITLAPPSPTTCVTSVPSTSSRWAPSTPNLVS